MSLWLDVGPGWGSARSPRRKGTSSPLLGRMEALPQVGLKRKGKQRAGHLRAGKARSEQGASRKARGGLLIGRERPQRGSTQTLAQGGLGCRDPKAGS